MKKKNRWKEIKTIHAFTLFEYSIGNASFQREQILNDQISVSFAAAINLNFKVIISRKNKMFPHCTCQEHARQGQDINRFDQIRSRLAFEQVHENGMRPRPPHLIYTVIDTCSFCHDQEIRCLWCTFEFELSLSDKYATIMSFAYFTFTNTSFYS